MPEHSRMEARSRRRRKSGPNGLVIVVAVLAVGACIAAGLYFWVASTLKAGPASTAGQTQAPAKPAATPTTPTKSVPATPAATAGASGDASATVTQTDSEAAAAAQASVKAAEKAAVPFPDAPAIGIRTSISQLHPKHKYIAITLDDGYNFQPKMLDLFKQYDVKCTTFLIGSWAASNIADVKLMRDAGFEIGNHSWTHPFLSHMSSSQIASELTRTQRVITSVTGNQAPYLRPPYGATNSTVKAAAARLGYRIVMWDRTFGDSGRGATPTKLYSNVMYSGGGVQPGDIILCHWGSKPSYEALKRILPDLRAKGYQFVTISELIADSK